jgi:hypothetical protein
MRSLAGWGRLRGCWSFRESRCGVLVWDRFRHAEGWPSVDPGREGVVCWVGVGGMPAPFRVWRAASARWIRIRRPWMPSLADWRMSVWRDDELIEGPIGVAGAETGMLVAVLPAGAGAEAECPGAFGVYAGRFPASECLPFTYRRS